jgi:hypothetical protein
VRHQLRLPNREMQHGDRAPTWSPTPSVENVPTGDRPEQAPGAEALTMLPFRKRDR